MYPNHLEYLKTRPEIDAERIGLIGHSEGGLIAPLAASVSSAFEAVIAQQKTLLEELFAIAKNADNVDQTIEEIKSVMLAPYAELSEEELGGLSGWHHQ